jgi:hypothetical protein
MVRGGDLFDAADPVVVAFRGFFEEVEEPTAPAAKRIVRLAGKTRTKGGSGA